MKVSVRLTSLAVAAALAAAASAARAAERPLRLQDAISLAVANDDRLAAERDLLRAAEASESGAHGVYDPVLEFSGGWRHSTLPVFSSFSGAPVGLLAPTIQAGTASADLRQLLPTGGSVALRGSAERRTSDSTYDLFSPSYTTGVGIELRQPLLRDRAIDAARVAVQVAGADHASANADLHRELADTVAQVEQTYWTLVAARRQVEVREEAVRLAEEQRSETDHRIRSGVAPETEAAQPRAELERRRGELLAAREAASRAENALKLLVAADDDAALWNDTLQPVEDAAPTVEPVDVSAAMEQALAGRPELRARDAALERRRAERALAVDAVRPVLDLVASYDRYGAAGTARTLDATSRLRGNLGDSLDMLGNGDLYDGRVGVVLAVPLTNRAARAGAEAARSNESAAQADLDRARKQVRSEVLDAAAARETAGQRIEAARAGRAAAEVQLDAERQRYGAGMSTNFLVLTRQNDLSSARLEEIAAQTDYRRAATEMARVTGTLLAARGVEEGTHGAKVSGGVNR